MTPGAAAILVAAALAEIGGCYAFWAWARDGRSPLWLVPGIAALLLFAWLLTLSPADAAGRAFAAYGGIYITAALAWLLVVEGGTLRATDLAGGGLALAGCAVILWGAR
ncbi:small multidrug resistance family-3 protein [Sphingomonas jejuensis]|uniref:Small multidrug resistance family-3 protein n=1 Tax=Sphingomonas jejuensis TaxID=904715 RepID=A0ABX0XQD8_9SPHN|nr:YnfA family protein [Sphingomonas jejuensis]NJC35062.1 small multidrug resistance family-3 protein [Sphingomonas jejuensis]